MDFCYFWFGGVDVGVGYDVGVGVEIVGCVVVCIFVVCCVCGGGVRIVCGVLGDDVVV